MTLPIEIRRMLGVKPRDRVVFSVENGEVKIAPAPYTLESIRGSVDPPTSTEDFEQMIREAKEERTERVVASLSPS